MGKFVEKIKGMDQVTQKLKPLPPAPPPARPLHRIGPGQPRPQGLLAGGEKGPGNEVGSGPNPFVEKRLGFPGPQAATNKNVTIPRQTDRVWDQFYRRVTYDTTARVKPFEGLDWVEQFALMSLENGTTFS